MAKCPRCGGEVAKERKSWPLRGRRSKVELTIGIFDCPNCNKPFRAVLSKRKI